VQRAFDFWRHAAGAWARFGAEVIPKPHHAIDFRTANRLRCTDCITSIESIALRMLLPNRLRTDLNRLHHLADAAAGEQTDGAKPAGGGCDLAILVRGDSSSSASTWNCR